MKGTKKCLVAGLITSILTTALTGCGDNPPSLTQEQKFQLEMAKIQANKEIQVAKAENVSVVYNSEVQDEEREDEVQQATSANETVIESYDSSNNSESSSNLLGVAAAGVAGYAIGSVLSNGYREFTDSDGSTRYVDKDGKTISERDYNEYRSKNPTLEKARDLNARGQSRAGAAIQTAKGKVSRTTEALSKSKTGQYVKQKAKKVKAQAKKTSQVVKQKYNKRKKR